MVKAGLKQSVLRLCLQAASDLQSHIEGCKVRKILVLETLKVGEPKLRLWIGTDGNKVAEERTDPCRSLMLYEFGKVRWRTGMYYFMC